MILIFPLVPCQLMYEGVMDLRICYGKVSRNRCQRTQSRMDGEIGQGCQTRKEAFAEYVIPHVIQQVWQCLYYVGV